MKFSKRKWHFLFLPFLCWTKKTQKNKKQRKQKISRINSALGVGGRWGNMDVVNMAFKRQIAKQHLCLEGAKGQHDLHWQNHPFLLFLSTKPENTTKIGASQGKTQNSFFCFLFFFAKSILLEGVSGRLFMICCPQKLRSAGNTILIAFSA